MTADSFDALDPADVLRRWHQHNADPVGAALLRLVEALWDEFTTDLIEGDNDPIDQAYNHACDVLGISHRRFRR